MSLKILATGDLHIGRCPTRVEPELAARFSCAKMWGSIVDAAIKHNVDVVALSGDVVDQANRFFEATGPLERGLDRLAEAGIETFAVAGNHDHDVLPRVVDAVGPEKLRLLGRGGRWQQATVTRDGKPVLNVHGWSFPSSHYPSSPLADYRLEVDDYVPTLGLLHADLEATGSRYAPVMRPELSRHNVALWLLGHVHRPQLFEDDATPSILYPGSPQAMDPGETGIHGPWLIEITGPRSIEAKQLPLSKVRYESIEVDLTGADSAADAQDRIMQRLGEFHAEAAERRGETEVLSARVQLTGQTAACGQISEFDSALADYDPNVDGLSLRIERTVNDTRPPVDLDELSKRRDAPGSLARTLLSLDASPPDLATASLLRNAHAAMQQAARASTYEPISDDVSPSIDDARDSLRRQAVMLLDALQAQEQPS